MLELDFVGSVLADFGFYVLLFVDVAAPYVGNKAADPMKQSSLCIAYIQTNVFDSAPCFVYP